MTPTVPTSEPETITAGDTVRWTKSLPDYPPGEGWALAYTLRPGHADAAVVVTPPADGYVYEAVIAAAASTNLSPGTHQLTGRVSKAGEVYTVASARVNVSADPTQLPFAERMIPLLEQALERRAAVDLKAYTILSRAATREELLDIRRLLAHCRAEVVRQQNGGRLPSIEVVFGRA